MTSNKPVLEEPLVINKTGNKPERRRSINELLEEVKLTPAEDFLPKFPHMLSGGQDVK